MVKGVENVAKRTPSDPMETGLRGKRPSDIAACHFAGELEIYGKVGAPMEHGVPQGRILGPLFFILFINYLPLHVSSQVDLYADDTTITAFAHFNNLPELKLSLNISANAIRRRADSNKLPINESKS